MKVVNKNIVLIVIGIMIFILGQIGVNYFIYKGKNNVVIPKVKLKNQEEKRDTFAIMLQQEDGTYQATDSKSFNQPGYAFNNDKSGCIDTNGNKINNALSYNEATQSVVLSVNSTAYCYVYFDLETDDINIIIKTDGVSGKLPTTAGYKNTLNCSKGTASFNNKYQRLEITDVRSNCTLNYEKDTSSHTSLISKVQGASGIVNEGIAGYRYEGQNPNNYIWFNNEMWRIIGSIPTKVDASGTTTNLVKIIRKDSLGGIAYDAKTSGDTGAWGSNTLYTLLNEYYYGKKDATNTDYCNGSQYGEQSKTKGDYRVNGISSDSKDYYGKMVKNVYWNTGASNNETTASAVYTTEKATQTVQGRIGLMSASDFGYAASATYHSTNINSYNTVAITLSNWLFSQGDEWTSTQSSEQADYVLNVADRGYIGSSYVYTYYAYRPVLYLSAEVYVMSGSGTEADPYIIGM